MTHSLSVSVFPSHLQDKFEVHKLNNAGITPECHFMPQTVAIMMAVGESKSLTISMRVALDSDLSVTVVHTPGQFFCMVYIVYTHNRINTCRKVFNTDTRHTHTENNLPVLLL